MQLHQAKRVASAELPELCYVVFKMLSELLKFFFGWLLIIREVLATLSLPVDLKPFHALIFLLLLFLVEDG